MMNLESPCVVEGHEHDGGVARPSRVATAIVNREDGAGIKPGQGDAFRFGVECGLAWPNSACSSKLVEQPTCQSEVMTVQVRPPRLRSVAETAELPILRPGCAWAVSCASVGRR